MMKKNSSATRIFLLTLSFLLATGFAQASEKLKIAVSILPQAYFVEQIGRDKVEVSVMIPPGGNPHTYEPTPGQLKKAGEARLYFKVGTGLDFEDQWMDRLSSLNPGLQVIDTAKGIRLIPMGAGRHGHEEQGEEENHEEHAKASPHSHRDRPDPHVWLSPDNAVIMAKNIQTALAEADPQNRDFYIANTGNLIARLKDLKQEIRQKLAGLEHRTFLIFHPAWGYFAADFHLTQVAAEQFGKEPTPKQLALLIAQANRVNARVIFASPQFSVKSARVIADEIHGRVELIDPLAKDYMKNLRSVADALAGP